MKKGTFFLLYIYIFGWLLVLRIFFGGIRKKKKKIESWIEWKVKATEKKRTCCRLKIDYNVFALV